MNVLELSNDYFELVGTRDDLLKYLKNMLVKFIQDGDVEAMRNTDLRDYADLFEQLVEKSDSVLLKIDFVECAMSGTATLYLHELVEKEN